MGKGGEAGGGGEGGVRRGWCVVAMETPSPSLIIIWGKMARGLLPRVTPPPPFLPTPLSLPSLPLPSRWQLRFFFCFHLAFFLRTPPRSSLPPPPPRPSPASAPPPTASSTPSTSHPASPRRLIAPRHLLCSPREYYACTLPGRLCNHP